MNISAKIVTTFSYLNRIYPALVGLLCLLWGLSAAFGFTTSEPILTSLAGLLLLENWHGLKEDTD